MIWQRLKDHSSLLFRAAAPYFVLWYLKELVLLHLRSYFFMHTSCNNSYTDIKMFYTYSCHFSSLASNYTWTTIKTVTSTWKQHHHELLSQCELNGYMGVLYMNLFMLLYIEQHFLLSTLCLHVSIAITLGSTDRQHPHPHAYCKSGCQRPFSFN